VVVAAVVLVEPLVVTMLVLLVLRIKELAVVVVLHKLPLIRQVALVVLGLLFLASQVQTQQHLAVE
jgi:hypothetical protein